MTTLRLLDSESSSVAVIKLRLLDSTSVQTSTGTTVLHILNGTSVNLTVGTVLQVLNSTSVNQSTAIGALNGPATAQPLDLVVLDASASVGTITSIAQVSGTSVTLAGTGASRTFTAPAVFSSTGVTSNLVFRVTMSGGSTDDHTIILYPHGEWVVAPGGGSWIPRFRYGRDPATLLPIGAVAGWGAQTFALDFTTPIPLGGFQANSSGVLVNTLGGTTAQQAYGAVLNVDTVASTALSVPTDGYLDIWLRSGIVCAVRPAIPAQTYGRYAFRFRAVSVAAGWSMAMGLLPQDGILPNHGEIDFPAGDLADDVLVYFTPASPTGVPAGVSTGENWTDDWHIGVIEWKTSSLKIFIDSVQVYTATANVPSTPMLFSIRPSGTSSTDAHFHLDWVAAWSV